MLSHLLFQATKGVLQLVHHFNGTPSTALLHARMFSQSNMDVKEIVLLHGLMFSRSDMDSMEIVLLHALMFSQSNMDVKEIVLHLTCLRVLMLPKGLCYPMVYGSHVPTCSCYSSSYPVDYTTRCRLSNIGNTSNRLVQMCMLVYGTKQNVFDLHTQGFSRVWDFQASDAGQPVPGD